MVKVPRGRAAETSASERRWQDFWGLLLFFVGAAALLCLCWKQPRTPARSCGRRPAPACWQRGLRPACPHDVCRSHVSHRLSAAFSLSFVARFAAVVPDFYYGAAYRARFCVRVPHRRRSSQRGRLRRRVVRRRPACPARPYHQLFIAGASYRRRYPIIGRSALHRSSKSPCTKALPPPDASPRLANPSFRYREQAAGNRRQTTRRNLSKIQNPKSKIPKTAPNATPAWWNAPSSVPAKTRRP